MSANPEPQPSAAYDADSRPKLLFFYSESSGRSRRAEGFLAQVLQRRRNHDTFQLYRIDYNARPDEAPTHRVTLSAFRIAVLPVTNADYAPFLAATGHKPPRFWDDPAFNSPRQPVVGMSWP